MGLLKRLQLLVAHHDAALGELLARHMSVFVQQGWAALSTLLTDLLGKQVRARAARERPLAPLPPALDCSRLPHLRSGPRT